MKSNHKEFDFIQSLERIDNILNDKTTHEEADNIPAVGDLNYNDGKFVECTAFFIDLRDSTNLSGNQNKKTRSIARIYRTYISEIVAIVNGFKSCKEINIVGDSVSAMFAGTGKKEKSDQHVIEALKAASMSNAMMKVLNVKYKKKWGDFPEVKAGIGLASGRVLVIKTGFSGSKIEELVYMGDTVNKASKMCSLAHKEYNSPICVTEKVYENANGYITNSKKDETFQDYLSKRKHPQHGIVYIGSFVRVYMDTWVNKYS